VTDYLVIVAISALAVLILSELVAAALPVLIVIAMVPREEREGLARLLAACDSSRKLRLWPALRLAVRARRAETKGDRSADRH
jgi:putative exporter of polyketide antibiotics